LQPLTSGTNHCPTQLVQQIPRRVITLPLGLRLRRSE
jgi:hypothetical protein